jgi:sterol desaturase/sphingolipid hydroxylase (fatty acid hydroxylase superfamily)
MYEFLKNPYYFFILLSIVNILFYVVNFFLATKRAKCLRTLLVEVSKSDWKSSLWILFLNIVVAIPGYLLFYYDVVNFEYSTSIWTVLFDFLLLLLVVDFLTFVAHLLAHKVSFLKDFHLVHHAHVEFNELSLYVMHPAEAIGLGLMFTLLFTFMSFNIYAVIIFLIFNWYWGVIAHFTPKNNQKSKLLTNNIFHAVHHKEGDYNYGFYTTVWDRIFKSYY